MKCFGSKRRKDSIDIPFSAHVSMLNKYLLCFGKDNKHKKSDDIASLAKSIDIPDSVRSTTPGTGINSIGTPNIDSEFELTLVHDDIRDIHHEHQITSTDIELNFDVIDGISHDMVFFLRAVHKCILDLLFPIFVFPVWSVLVFTAPYMSFFFLLSGSLLNRKHENVKKTFLYYS